MQVRFRTLGDATCTGAIESPAFTVAQIVNEVASYAPYRKGWKVR